MTLREFDIVCIWCIYRLIFEMQSTKEETKSEGGKNVNNFRYISNFKNELFPIPK